MTTQFASRRKFLRQSAAIGGGLTVGFHVPESFAQGKGGALSAIGAEINAWVVVRPDDTVIILVPLEACR